MADFLRALEHEQVGARGARRARPAELSLKRNVAFSSRTSSCRNEPGVRRSDRWAGEGPLEFFLDFTGFVSGL